MPRRFVVVVHTLGKEGKGMKIILHSLETSIHSNNNEQKVFFTFPSVHIS